MGALTRNIKEKEQNERKRKEGRIPRYKKDGTLKRRFAFIPTTIGLVIILIGLSIAAIHIPTLLYKPSNDTEVIYYPSNPDEAGLRYALQYVKDNPDKDFDSDGLTNTEELLHNTDPRNPDSDMDGISDYAEIHLYNTRPLEYNAKQLQEIVNDLLKEKEIQVTDPYKIHDVVMWADNIASRSAGTVIPTIRGYRFSKFDGWVQFPGNVYAYKIEGNIHTPLEHRELENAWRVESYAKDTEVVTYSEKLETTHLLTLFGKRYFVDDGVLSDIMSYILPREHSFITYKEIVKQDTYDIRLNATVTGTVMPKYDVNDMSRFGESTNEFTSLTAVYTSIMSGKPVVVSLQSASYGETIALVYGYTEYGDLLLADTQGNTEDEYGRTMMLEIVEKPTITIDQTGVLRQREFFEFNGLGYDSTIGDKIHFLLEK